MRFLVDADLPRNTAPLLARYGHEAQDVRDIGLGIATDRVIAQHAQRISACIVTGDFGFADVRNYPPAQYMGIVVLELPGTAGVQFILSLVEAFIQQDAVLQTLPRRLAIVSPGRIRFRPPL